MKRSKYPRTPHLRWSPGATSDDKWLEDPSCFNGREVVVTEKLDGENTTVYPDGTCHARSLSSGPHPSRDWMRALAGRIGRELPHGWRICGENLFAVHSIAYSALPSFFLAFGMMDRQRFMSWDEVIAWANLLDLTLVPVLYRGPWNEEAIRACFTGRSCYGGEQEGYVVRLAQSFDLSSFGRSIAKYVQASHVQTDEHWMSRSVVKNGLALRG